MVGIEREGKHSKYTHREKIRGGNFLSHLIEVTN